MGTMKEFADSLGKPKEPARVFVFGSNLAGRHGKGAALFARQNYGAVYGEGLGRTGDAYAIPTKDAHLGILPLEEVERHIRDFSVYATENPKDIFLLTPIGTGLAGYSREEIFTIVRNSNIPRNVVFTKEWFGL